MTTVVPFLLRFHDYDDAATVYHDQQWLCPSTCPIMLHFPLISEGDKIEA